MTRKDQEIDVQCLDVDPRVSHCLRRIDQDKSTDLLRRSGHFCHGIDGAKRVRNPSEREEFCPLTEQVEERLLVQRAVFVARNDF